jgi:hypothetical protein
MSTMSTFEVVSEKFYTISLAAWPQRIYTHYRTSKRREHMATLKADSHIACRAHAMPCRYGFRMCPSHLIYTAAVSDLHLPCHAPTMPLCSRRRHSTAVERLPVGYLQAFGFFRLPRGVPRKLSEAYQSQMQVASQTTTPFFDYNNTVTHSHNHIALIRGC